MLVQLFKLLRKGLMHIEVVPNQKNLGNSKTEDPFKSIPNNVVFREGENNIFYDSEDLTKKNAIELNYKELKIVNNKYQEFYKNLINNPKGYN